VRGGRREQAVVRVTRSRHGKKRSYRELNHSKYSLSCGSHTEVPKQYKWDQFTLSITDYTSETTETIAIQFTREEMGHVIEWFNTHYAEKIT
jgi:hypothetical protein